jgi:serine/threonine protein kinase
MSPFYKQITLPGEEEAQATLPSSIGPYKIESLLDKGGMSYVYLALHPTTKERIVVKVMSAQCLARPEMGDRFLQEAKIIAMAHHPNIVKLYGQGPWEKGLYIAMEFIQGTSLRESMRRRRFSQKESLALLLQIAYALCHLHTQGVVHRDLKPENILITEQGTIKVIDFGVAKWNTASTKQGTMRVGTPYYMSPEQKKNASAASYTSDLYSLGVIAYELFLGKPSHGIIHLHLVAKPLRTLLEKLLQPDPKERCQDVVDFIQAVLQNCR